MVTVSRSCKLRSRSVFWSLFVILAVVLEVSFLIVLVTIPSFAEASPPLILSMAVFLALVALATARLISLRIRKEISGLGVLAERALSGNFEARASSGRLAEIEPVVAALNQLMEDVESRIRQLERRKAEQDAVMSSLIEGILAIDMDERIININRAAAQMFGLVGADARGRHVQEIVRNSPMQKMISRSISGDRAIHEEVVLDGQTGKRHFDIYSAPLRDNSGEKMGILIVLNDITHLRKLENIRKDFVANVSHELKTPITSIKGFVETLIDGAIDRPDDARRFLDIISRQADRLNAIIEDLLSLSRIEQEADRGGIALGVDKIKPVVQAAVNTCDLKAKEKNISIGFHCDDDPKAMINPALLEQAIVNLIDNAIKYSEPGQSVKVTCTTKAKTVRISVIDNGCGIEKSHIPRLFERFYRVDKSRSRQAGGTGLGLAIVKHIVLAHKGAIDVESTPGKGSSFSIELPSFDSVPTDGK